jgi:hypothetical protein
MEKRHWIEEIPLKELVGNLVEIKIGKDFGIHTEQLERFRDECYRMMLYHQKNPHVNLHAVWYDEDRYPNERKIQLWYHICQQYQIWGHIVHNDTELIEFLKALDQPSQYQLFAPFIKRSHEEPTTLAKMLRQFPGISSAKAIDLATAAEQKLLNLYDGFGYPDVIIDTLGRKKDGTPKKLALDLIKWLEEGGA